MQTFQYYGSACAVCDIAVGKVLEAAHIRPKAQNGSDDPRNGLVLCATHHRAYDNGLFAIEPESLDVRLAPGGPSAGELRIAQASLKHLKRPPHHDALQWAWMKWTHRAA